MTRATYIEQILRLVYGGYIPDDSEITDNLVNLYINQGLALAIKQNYKDAIQLDGVGYVNNAFYLTYKGLTISQDEISTYKLQLPQLPIAIGRNEGVSTLQLKDTNGLLSEPLVALSQSQKGYYQGLRNIPNKLLYYNEGNYLYIVSVNDISDYTAIVTLVSGGNSTDLTSELNVPDDYISFITDYCFKMLNLELRQPKDTQNDGAELATAKG